MSKTGKEWYDEAEVLRKEGKIDEAMAKYNASITAFQDTPDLGESDFFTLQGMAEKLIYNLPKREEALIVLELCDKCKVNDKALYAGVNLNRGNAYLALDKIDKAREAFIASVEGGSKYPESYAMAGSLSEDIGNFDAALKYFNQGLALNAKDYKSNLLKANFLLARGKPNEAKTIYLDILSRQPNDSLTNYKLASIYNTEGNKDAARKCYEMGAAMNSNTSASWAARGQCLSMLGRSDEAMEKFKKAQNILETNKTAISAPWFVNNTKAALKAVLEAEETAKKVQAEVAQLDQDNPAVKKFSMNMKALQEKKIAAQNKALDDAGKKETATKDGNLSDLDKIKEEFQKQLEALKKEMAEFKTEVKTDIKNLKNNMQEMKEEIASKMDDFSKKLDIELNKKDFSDEDKQKLKSYFKAFIGTISSAHVTAQVVDSGMVQLDSDSSAATVLSFMASFAPFVGSALQTGIKSIGDFLQTKEMKSNARILKGLAPDAVALSQIIGKTGFGILMDKKKQEEILKTTDQEMNKLTGNTFQKIFEFCRQVNEKIDVFLYTQLYKTVPERMANADANELIDLWTKGKVMPFGIEDQFINHILNPPKGGKEDIGHNAPEKVTRSACCNMF